MLMSMRSPYQSFEYEQRRNGYRRCMHVPSKGHWEEHRGQEYVHSCHLLIISLPRLSPAAQAGPVEMWAGAFPRLRR